MNNFDTTQNSADYLMTINKLGVGLNFPPALKSTMIGDTEVVHGLPAYRPRRTYLVDEYPACPANWMRSTGRIKSYFVPVPEGEPGLWLDFNSLWSHPNHQAIVVSIQGVNAVSGLAAKTPALEQYRDNCPKHKIPFSADRLCTKCKFKWPKQNYLASAATPYGGLWLDGFRAEDGVIRQYVFTEQKMRGVAKHVIGEDRVFALGISFFLSKTARPAMHPSVLRGFYGLDIGGSLVMPSAPGVSVYTTDNSVLNGSWTTSACSNQAKGQTLNYMSVDDDTPIACASAGGPSATYSASLASPVKKLTYSASLASPVKKLTYSASLASPVKKLVTTKQLDVAAGARIRQDIHDDPNEIEFYQSEPEGLIIVNYVCESECEAILAGGKVDLQGDKEGFLQNVPVGN